MDMNKILQNFETAAKGEYTPSKQESSDMKMILESFYEVAADDAKPQQLDEIASVSMSGETADEVAQLIKLLNDAGAPEAAPVGAQPTTMHEPAPCDGPPDMPPKDTMITPKMMDEFESAEEPVEEGQAKQILHRKAEMMDREDFVADAGDMGMTAEEAGEFWDAVNGETESYDNEPNERYNDHETMTLDLSGGINRRKKSYKRAEPGDNPMAVESSLKEELSKMLKKKMSESSRDEDDDYQDYLEYRAEAKATGQEVMSYDEWSGKTSARGRAEDRYKRASQYYDPDDPAFDDYMEGTIKTKSSKSVRKKMSEKKDQDGDGDNDFDDVQIARMKASGMSHDEAVAKVKGKKEGSKKNSDTEVDEAKKKKGPCWSGYKMVGTKKKNGKEVPNCVPEGVEEAAPKNNPVAKNAGKFNKAQVQTDKKKEMKKGKGVKHKGKDFAMESAPVFDRYVKPIINKTPKQMVEFYEREARTIINRLSRERRSLAETNGDTKMHDVVIGRLRENLDAVPDSKKN